MSFSGHPVWAAGFRPFFTLACLAGALLPPLWIAVYAGWLVPSLGSVSIVQWHAHEMFFGFGWAVLGGFLLTSTKNWVGVRGYHGSSLVFLAAAWLLDRLSMACQGLLPHPLFLLANNLFLVSIVAMLMWTLIRYSKGDNFRDNYFFLLALPLFVVAKVLLLGAGSYGTGVIMVLGLFRVAFLIMFERTLTQFMQNTFKVAILRDPRLDFAIKSLALVLVFAGWMPAPLATALDCVLALLLLWRFAHWYPQLALRRLELGISYLGYLAIVAQLLIAALDASVAPTWTGSVSMHVFSFGVMGLVTPAMITRISLGHTGRKVQFESRDKLVLQIMIVAVVLRLAGPQLVPTAYLAWLGLSAACWCVGFALLTRRCLPLLWRPRADGKAG